MLPQFLHVKNPLEPASDYILCTDAPFIIGKIVQFKNGSDLTDFIAKKKAGNRYFLGFQVPGYNILVIIAGALHKSYSDEDAGVIKDMATEYLQDRIEQRKQRFNRFKI